jgi:ferredoxin-NADP reductase
VSASYFALASPARYLRGAAKWLSAPLLPDDYLSMINPLWSARELRGKVVRVIPETEDAATLVIEPGWGWRFDHRPGQYVGIAVAIDGRFVWRSYSLTCLPTRRHGDLSITVKAMPEGRMSTHLVRGLAPGTVVRLAPPRGDFVLSDPPPPKLLFVTAGSGITPVIAMLRTMDRRGVMPDVVLAHSAPDLDAVLFRQELHDIARRHRAVELHERFTGSDGRLTLVGDLEQFCPDWRERETWVCGPNAMLDEAKWMWAAAGLDSRLHIERFGAALAGGEAGVPTGGGTVRFAVSGRSIEVDGATTLMEAGERAGVLMPFGCRIGICHTCVVPLVDGRVRDLRDGAHYDGDDRRKVQTCVTAPAGNCVLEL